MTDRTARFAAAAFPDLPPSLRDMLWKQNLKTGDELRAMTDKEIVALVGVDSERLKTIRAKYPFIPDDSLP